MAEGVGFEYREFSQEIASIRKSTHVRTHDQRISLAELSPRATRLWLSNAIRNGPPYCLTVSCYPDAGWQRRRAGLLPSRPGRQQTLRSRLSPPLDVPGSLDLCFITEGSLKPIIERWRATASPLRDGPRTAHRRSRAHDLSLLRRSRRQPRRGRHLLGRPLMIGCSPVAVLKFLAVDPF
jgi:hypothetical protein